MKSCSLFIKLIKTSEKEKKQAQLPFRKISVGRTKMSSPKVDPQRHNSTQSVPDYSSSTVQELNTDFCSLNDECIHNIFDWLSIADLCRFRVTCKRLYLLANEHYPRTYGQAITRYGGHRYTNINIEKYHKSFASFAQKVRFTSTEKLHEIGLIINQHVKYISFKSGVFEQFFLLNILFEI